MTGSLEWNIKTAFRSYVAAIPDGTEQWLSPHGALEPSTFRFDLVDDSAFDADSLTGSLRFAGAVRFRGYRGALLVSIADPVLEIEGDRILISVDIATPGTAADRTPFAVAVLPQTPTPNHSDSESDTWRAALVWHVPQSRLSAEGGMLLGSVYREGTELDPFICTISKDQHA
ncbi:MAG: hypothetical protein JWQ64_3535 [Subtercola sp.]|nr:hypothetical protein [Subtercola sp.]